MSLAVAMNSIYGQQGTAWESYRNPGARYDILCPAKEIVYAKLQGTSLMGCVHISPCFL